MILYWHLRPENEGSMKTQIRKQKTTLNGVENKVDHMK